MLKLVLRVPCPRFRQNTGTATASMMFSKGSQSSGDPRLKFEYDTRARAIFKIGPHLQGHKQMIPILPGTYQKIRRGKYGV